MFYPADWRKDPALRVCSIGARGLWIDMLALMHEGDPYGYLVVNGEAVSVAQLARLIGEPLGAVRKLLAELESRNVFSRNDDGVIFSRRMVADEHIREVRAASGKLGGNPALTDKRKDKPVVADVDKQTAKQTPTPSVAVALAVAVAPSGASSSSGAVEFAPIAELLSRIPAPQRPAWAAEIEASRQGMHGDPLNDEQIDRACRDYIGNGDFENPSMRHFRAYLRSASKALPSTGGNPFTTPEMQRWAAEQDAKEAARA